MPFIGGRPPGILELVIILVVVMMIFGVGKLPQVGNAMGKALREFKSSSENKESSSDTDDLKPTAKKYDPVADGVATSPDGAKEPEKETPAST